MAIEFTVLFLDTNVLDQAWPKPSVKLEVTLDAARQLGVAVELPHAVRVELNRRWRERVRSQLQTTEETLKHLGLVPNPTFSSIIPDWATVETAYKSRVDELLARWNIVITAMPSITLSEVFSQATERAIVFGEQGRNFQDAVIFHSVVERLSGVSGAHGLLITKDGIFSERKDILQAYCSKRSASLDIMKPETAERYFSSKLSEAQKKRYERHKELARQAVTAFLPQFQEMVNKAAAHPGSVRPGQRVVRNISFTQVVDVDVSVIREEPTSGSEVRLSAVVRGSAEEFTSLDQRGQSILSTGRGPQPFEAGFTATATFNGTYGNIRVNTMSWMRPGMVGNAGQAT